MLEDRDPKDYAEPVDPGKLRPGTVYFSLQFFDEELLVPILEPFVFLGKDLLHSGEGRLYFQTFESYQQGLRFETAKESDREVFQVASPEGIKHMFEYARYGRIDELRAKTARTRCGRIEPGDSRTPQRRLASGISI